MSDSHGRLWRLWQLSNSPDFRLSGDFRLSRLWRLSDSGDFPRAGGSPFLIPSPWRAVPVPPWVILEPFPERATRDPWSCPRARHAMYNGRERFKPPTMPQILRVWRFYALGVYLYTHTTKARYGAFLGHCGRYAEMGVKIPAGMAGIMFRIISRYRRL